MELAAQLDGLLAGVPPNRVIGNRGLWAWLALAYFDSLCPIQTDGRRKPGDRARWMLQADDYRKYYRHLLAGPYRIFIAHRARPAIALGVLCTPPAKPGEIAEQLASRHDLITNPAVMEVTTELYVNATTGGPKRGSGSKGPGGPRRLATVLDQLDLTWDLRSMSAKTLLEMLPKEFKRFRIPAQSPQQYPTSAVGKSSVE